MRGATWEGSRARLTLIFNRCQCNTHKYNRNLACRASTLYHRLKPMAVQVVLNLIATCPELEARAHASPSILLTPCPLLLGILLLLYLLQMCNSPSSCPALTLVFLSLLQLYISSKVVSPQVSEEKSFQYPSKYHLSLLSAQEVFSSL
jgi:hypothetical protein